MLKKVGNVEMSFRGVTDGSCCRGEGAMDVEKGETERESRIQTNAKVESFPNAWKTKGAKFC